MCHPGETDYIPVDKTWGILDPLVYLYPSCCECDFIFFNTLTTVLITPSLYFLQYEGAHKLISRSTTFLKEFFQRPNQRSGRGLSL